MNDQRAQEFIVQLPYSVRRACETKVKFPSKKIAMAKARLINRAAPRAPRYGHPGHTAHQGPMQVYKCPLCRKYHLGHDKIRPADFRSRPR
jgi:hypothetical protein